MSVTVQYFKFHMFTEVFNLKTFQDHGKLKKDNLTVINSCLLNTRLISL